MTWHEALDVWANQLQAMRDELDNGTIPPSQRMKSAAKECDGLVQEFAQLRQQTENAQMVDTAMSYRRDT
jgi:hypothetical protein